MTTFTGTSGADTANATSGTLTGFTGGSVAELQDSTGDIFDGLGSSDTIVAGTGADTITGGAAADTLNGGEGSDIYQFSNGDFVSGESLNDGGSTSDTDVIALIGNATVIDFRVGTVLNIEALLFSDLQTAEFDQIQLPTNLSVTGEANSGQAVIVHMSTGVFTAAGWTFTDWGANDVVNIVGRALGDDIITGSSQDDFITGGGGDDSLNGGEGGDTYQYGSTSDAADDAINDSGVNGGFDRLFLFGDVDFTGAASITNIETIGFDGAHTATFNASQFGTGLIATDFLLNGANGTTQIVTVNAASNFSAINWALGVFWEAADTVVINGTGGADTITGTNATDQLNGGDGGDTLQSGQGADTLDGQDGSDVYVYSATGEAINDTISDTGTGGIDTVRVLGDVQFFGLASMSGVEAFDLTAALTIGFNASLLPASLAVSGDNGSLQQIVVANADNVSLAGWTFNDWEISDNIELDGGVFAGTMVGSSQRDIINGFQGEDTLTGGRGKDTLTGGTEADTFDYNSVKDSTKGANRDIITDFTGVNDLVSPDLDLIDLRTIDAKLGKSGNQKFKFIGAQKFHHSAGELQVKFDGTDTTIVSGDRNGDGRADFQIEVQSTEALAKADFLL